LWGDILSALEKHLGLEDGAIKGYVLIEQVKLLSVMEIALHLKTLPRFTRALGLHHSVPMDG